MDSRNIAARRRRATPRKSARATAAPSNTVRASQAPAATPTEAKGSARAPFSHGAWPSLPTALSFAPTPPGSLGASTPHGDQPPNDSSPGASGPKARREGGSAKTSEPLLPGPALPSAPLTDGLIWDDDEKALVGDPSVWQNPDQAALIVHEPVREDSADPWESLAARPGRARSDDESWTGRLRDWMATAAPFSWRERAWRRGFWRRRVLRGLSLLAVVLVVAVIAYGAFTLGLRATHTSLTNLVPVSSATPGRGGFVVSAPTGDQNATPTSPAYTIGTWVSNDTPSGGQVTLYARVLHNFKAVKGVSVVFTVQYANGEATYGPKKTDASGLAQVNITYSAGQGQVVFVIATTHVGGQDISADTSFTPF